MRRPERKEMKGRDRMSKVKNDQEFVYCHGIVVQHMQTNIFWHSLFKKKCCCLVAKSYPILLWPGGLKPARLFCSWDFPGKNTGMSEWHCSVVSNSLRPHGLYPTTLLRPWDFPGKRTGMGCHFLLQGIFPTQGLNQRLQHWQSDSLPLCHLGSPLKKKNSGF